MKCQHCSREIKLWQSTCPYCQNRTQSHSYSTITEATEAPEQKSRRHLLQQVLQFSLVAVTFIALASLVRFNPPKANPLPQESLRTPASTSPAPMATPELSRRVEMPIVAPAESEPESKPAPASQTLSLFSAEDLRLARNGAAPRARFRPAGSVAGTPKRSRAALIIAEVFADEAAPKKMVTPIAPSGSVAPHSLLATTTETDSQLEVETAGILLHPNTGLVTIKSYVPARVYIDGVYSGSTPRSVKLLAGEHTINLLANGYHDYSRKVKISGQQQLGILASMSKK